jgi:hypothetical protein
MADSMLISLCGKGAGGLADDLDAAGVKYDTSVPTPGVIHAAAGDILNIAHDAAPYAAIAAVLIAWVRARATRAITLTLNDFKIIHAKGYSVDDLEVILRITKRVDVIDTAQLDASEPAAHS